MPQLATTLLQRFGVREAKDGMRQNLEGENEAREFLRRNNHATMYRDQKRMLMQPAAAALFAATAVRLLELWIALLWSRKTQVFCAGAVYSTAAAATAAPVASVLSSKGAKKIDSTKTKTQ
ncbi:hypothetical protein cyc_01468 [Cyclospora cayetanensis]|uniref:Uncharacterized protein n=1 Tax=Cyclospora cayetanensis TaxID=88456 RepID=A0A1D3CR25_9EIME|nr:hypothetical protein cyc_01468 [Cyclospora cayetanensis]